MTKKIIYIEREIGQGYCDICNHLINSPYDIGIIEDKHWWEKVICFDCFISYFTPKMIENLFNNEQGGK